MPPSARFGFYAGWSGLVWAAARATEALGAPTGLDQAADLLDKLAHGEVGPEFDLISGADGTVAMFAAAARSIDPALGREVVERAAGWMLENAVRSDLHPRVVVARFISSLAWLSTPPIDTPHHAPAGQLR